MNYTKDIKNPKAYYGFALDKDMSQDKRQAKWSKQRNKRGFDDTECWDLFTTIAKFILPRFKEFKKQTIGTPTSFYPKNYSFDSTNINDNIEKQAHEKHMAALDKMIRSFEWIVDEDKKPSAIFYRTKFAKDDSSKNRKTWIAMVKKDDKLIQEGLQLFAKHFQTIWW